MPTGTVVWFCPKRGYGFLKQDNCRYYSRDVFCYYTSIVAPRGHFRSLKSGEQVQFDIGLCMRGIEATNVRRLYGSPFGENKYFEYQRWRQSWWNQPIRETQGRRFVQQNSQDFRQTHSEKKRYMQNSNWGLDKPVQVNKFANYHKSRKRRCNKFDNKTKINHNRSTEKYNTINCINTSLNQKRDCKQSINRKNMQKEDKNKLKMIAMLQRQNRNLRLTEKNRFARELKNKQEAAMIEREETEKHVALISKLQEQIKQLQESSSQKDGIIEELRHNIASLQDEAVRFSTTEQNLQKQITLLIEGKKTEQEEVGKTINDAVIRELQEKTKELQNDLSQKELTIEDLKQHANEIQSQKEELSQVVADLQEKLANTCTEKEYKETKRLNEAFVQRIKDLAEYLGKTIAENTKLKEELQTTQFSLQLSKGLIPQDEISEKNVRLQEKVEELQSFIDKCRKLIGEGMEDRKTLYDKVEEQKIKIKQLEEGNEKLKRKQKNRK